MKRICKRLTAVMLAIVLCSSGVIGQYETTQAASVAVPVSGELAKLLSTLMGVGMMLDLKELLAPYDPNWDYGDLLDDPATQDQIDATNKMLEKYYDLTKTKWYQEHRPDLTPTPKPTDVPNPPVTVPPVDPDTVEPLNYEEMMLRMQRDKILDVASMGAATWYCLKGAVSGLWETLVNDSTTVSNNDSSIDMDFSLNSASLSSYPVNLGKITTLDQYYGSKADLGNYFYYLDIRCKSLSSVVAVLQKSSLSSSCDFLNFYDSSTYKKIDLPVFSRSVKNGKDSGWSQGNCNELFLDYGDYYGYVKQFYYLNLNCPIYVGDSTKSPEDILKTCAPVPKNKEKLWPSTNLKGDYDANRAPSLPDNPPPAIALPTLEELINMQKQAKEDEERRPVIVENFITNHYVQPTPDPKPTESPDPNPTGSPDPDPNPTESPDPNPSGAPEPSGSPKPTGAPKPTGTPEQTDEDVDPEKYKADLRDVFPFCIPFDLIRLLQVFQAEPRAPVFEFPVDIEFTNPFTNEKILDYHEVFVFDFADYEEVIRILRIFQVIFFITGLMMITRQQMIKG